MTDNPHAQPERERAVDLAYRALACRERTVAELRRFLEGKRMDPAAIDAAVAELTEAGFVDDVRYARRFAEDKRTLERWGSERIGRELHKRGVSPELVDEVVSAQERTDELRAAVALLGERLPGPPRDDRDRDRAWRLLVRRGYEVEVAYEAVRAHARREAV
jgi:regulatory protein